MPLWQYVGKNLWLHGVGSKSAYMWILPSPLWHKNSEPDFPRHSSIHVILARFVLLFVQKWHFSLPHILPFLKGPQGSNKWWLIPQKGCPALASPGTSSYYYPPFEYTSTGILVVNVNISHPIHPSDIFLFTHTHRHHSRLGPIRLLYEPRDILK